MNFNKPSPVSDIRVPHTLVTANKQGAESEHSATSPELSALTLEPKESLEIEQKSPASSRSSSRNSSPTRPGSPTIQIAMAIKTRRTPERSQVPPMRSPSAMAAASFDAKDQVLHTDVGMYALGESVGKGSFGEILQAVAPTGRRVVVKVIDMSQDLKGATTDAERAAVVKKYRHEFSAMLKANASCQPLDMATADGKLFIVLRELRMHMGDEELRDAMRAQARPHAAKCMFHDISADLGRVHARGWLHRDLKLENFMADAEGHVVLIDFGETLALGQKSEVCNEDMDCNTDLFAPETYLHWDASATFGERKDTKASEMFSLGLCWAIMATGLDTHPFENNPAAHRAWPAVHASLPVDAHTGFVDVAALAAAGGEGKVGSLRAFVLKMCRADLAMGSYVAQQVWHPDPQARPGAEQACAHNPLSTDDLRVGRARLKQPLASEAVKEAQGQALILRHRELLETKPRPTARRL